MVGKIASGFSLAMIFSDSHPSDGFNVGDIRGRRIGHDGGGIAIDQYDLKAFLS
jgi:hypothetical protein